MDSKLTTKVSTTAVQIAAADTEQDHDLSAEFNYNPADPWAVTMTLNADGGPVVWTFARDLLLEGQYEPTGDGDVHVWPCLSPSGEAVVIVELDSPSGETLLQFPTRAVQDFIYASLETVPLGSENVDVDAWLDQLLASDA
ncbi:SsgA family sporulation/cell division regulator [Nocardioides marmoriginsengisoli]|uniref:SsgA family sporulation/cell division regulator n=1 Tax=Nocardioides marmoriginsengisoli TaxID=661483 RepID=A0A3N0CN19_9ACTN|nr:SsgA family sporulation/cell division regulator [Nocardioides marmoriginsengisoli]RNL64857.1 SsgA family sporulation/cell division regulator [Nocardioides marmoriginsengisoli]